MAKAEYKFKPYTPQNLKIASPQSSLTQQEKTLKSLQSQRDNLNARLQAEGIDPDTLGGEFDNRGFLEKALNLRPGQGFLMDTLEVINRPVEAIKSGLLAAVEGDNVIGGFAEGLAGKAGEGQEWGIRGSEFLKRVTGWEPETGVGKFIADVGVDIALDPLTYLPPGLLLKGFSKLGKIGGKTIAKELVVEGLESSAKTLAKQFADDVLKQADIIVKDPKNKINTLDEAVNSVLKSKNNTGVKQVYFFDQEFKTIDDMIAYIDKGGMELFPTIKQKTKLSQLQERLKAMKKLLDDPNYIAGLRGKGAKAEARYYKTVYNKIEALDDNIKVILNKAADRYDDVGIYYKTNINGKTALVQVDGVEVKQMFDRVGKGGKRLKSSAAFFSNNMLSFANDGKVIFGADTTLSKAAQDTISDTLSKVTVARNGTRVSLSEVFRDAYAKLQAQVAKGAKPSIRGMQLTNIFAQTDDAGRKALRTMFETLATDSKINYTFIETAVGSGKLIDVTENLKNFDEVFDIMVDTTQGAGGFQFRFKTGFNLKENANFLGAIDRTEELLKRFQNPSKAVDDKIFITLAGRARMGEFGEIAQKIAVSVKKLEINFKLAFNLTGGFSEETKTLVKRALGENLFELERRSARLVEIQNQLIKVDPEAGRLLGELIEAGAKIGADGKIVKLSRRIGTSDFLDYIYKRTADKAEILLPSFADAASQQNFLKKLNKLYRDVNSTTDDFFTVVTKDGGTALKFDGGIEEVEGLIKYYNEKTILSGVPSARGIPEYMEFGEKALSKKARALLESNAELVGQYRQLSDEILQELIDVAGFDNLPRELANQIGYMRHRMTQEAYEGMVKQLGEVSSIFSRPGTDALKKRVFLGSAEEVNAGLKAFMGLEMDLFDPNAFNAMEDLIKISQRKLDQYRMLDIILTQKGVNAEDLIRVVPNTKDFAKTLSPYDTMFKDFKEQFGVLYNNLSPAGKKRLDEFFKASGYASDKAIVMNKSAFNVLKGAEKAYIDLKPMVKLYDKFLNTWKGLTLVSPGFHLRNMFGNMFNSYAVGMGIADQGKYLTTALTELDQFQKIGKKLAQGSKLTASEQKIFDVVRGYFEQGVSQTHRGIRDLDQLKTTVDATKKAGKFKTGYNNVLRFNFNVAEKMDDVQRYALYRWSLDTTNDSAKAARTVSEALFDYSHLTPFEKDYMKRIFPFYTFMKNNFIFQAKNIFANPKQYARVGRAYRYGVEDLGGYNIDDLPDYAVENMWIPIPMTITKNDKDAIAFLKANLPLSDFTELIENPFKKGVISVTAPVKLLIEFGAGRDLFTGAPLQSFPGQTNALEPGTGVLAGVRDRRGNLTISQSPLFQKIMNDIGLRTPINVASAGLDIVDTLAGYQGPVENVGDFLQRAGLAGVQEVENLELTELYQDLERLRELKKYYEQETGNQLPVLPRG